MQKRAKKGKKGAKNADFSRTDKPTAKPMVVGCVQHYSTHFLNKIGKSLEPFFHKVQKTAKKGIKGQKGAKRGILAILGKKRLCDVSSLIDPYLSSCKILEKSLEPFPRKSVADGRDGTGLIL